MVIGIHHLLGLYIHGLAGSRLVVHYTAYLAFVAGRNGDHQTSLTERRRSVGIDQAVRLRLTEDRSQRTAHAALQVCHLASYPRQLGRSMVRQTAITVQDAVYGFDDLP